MKPTKSLVNSFDFPLEVSFRASRFGAIPYCMMASFITLSFSMSLGAILNLPYQEAMGIFPAITRALGVALVETILFQSLIFHFTRDRLTELGQLFFMTVPFGIVHIANGIVGIVNAIVVGAVLSIAYITWHKKSFKTSVIITSAIHAIHNATLLSI